MISDRWPVIVVVVVLAPPNGNAIFAALRSLSSLSLYLAATRLDHKPRLNYISALLRVVDVNSPMHLVTYTPNDTEREIQRWTPAPIVKGQLRCRWGFLCHNRFLLLLNHNTLFGPHAGASVWNF